MKHYRFSPLFPVFYKNELKTMSNVVSAYCRKWLPNHDFLWISVESLKTNSYLTTNGIPLVHLQSDKINFVMQSQVSVLVWAQQKWWFNSFNVEALKPFFFLFYLFKVIDRHTLLSFINCFPTALFVVGVRVVVDNAPGIGLCPVDQSNWKDFHL